MTPTFKNRPNELITTTDGRKLFHSRSVAVVVVLCCFNTSDDKYYFAIEKRGNNPGLDKKGMWCLPCGYLDWDESAPSAVRREVWEEIGLDTNELVKTALHGPGLDQPWFVKTEPDENRQNVTLRYGIHFCKAKLPPMTANNDCEPNEVAEAVWATYSDITRGEYDFAFNHDEVIKEYRDRYVKALV